MPQYRSHYLLVTGHQVQHFTEQAIGKPYSGYTPGKYGMNSFELQYLLCFNIENSN